MTEDLIKLLRERADSGELSTSDASYMRLAADELESLIVWHKDKKPEEKVVVLVSGRAGRRAWVCSQLRMGNFSGDKG